MIGVMALSPLVLSAGPTIDALTDGTCAMQGELFAFRTGSVRGAVFSSIPTTLEMQAFIRFLDCSLKEPHVSLIDFSRMESVDQAAFALLLAELEARYDALGRGVSRQILVHPKKL